MTFDERMELARDHESAVRFAVEAAGWNVNHFGYDLLSPEARLHLRLVDTPLRFLPDLLAFRGDTDDTRQTVLIDAKTKLSDKPNDSFNETALMTAMANAAYFRLPVVLVTHDLRVVEPAQVLEHGRRMDGRLAKAGSGLDYYLLPKNHGPRLDVYFSRLDIGRPVAVVEPS